MEILVCDNQEKNNNKEKELIKSNDIICPECKYNIWKIIV